MKLILTVIAILTVVFVHAQTTSWNVSGTDISSPNTGNVGIGTASPSQKLHIYNNSGVVNDFMIENTVAGGQSSIDFKPSGTGYILGASASANTTIANAFYLYNKTTSSFPLLVKDNNIFIGTLAPIYKLHVVGSGSATYAGSLAMFSSGTANAADIYGIAVDKAGTNSLLIGINKNSVTGSIPASMPFISTYSNTTGLSIGRGGNNGLPNKADLVIDGAGNVGIGTTAPQSLLAVKGTITAQKVVVTQTGWADYVFEPTYQLPSLQSVENFIHFNKHLPDVPSAADVTKDGIDLGDTQAVLLKKIEELTLYLIEQDKKQKEQTVKITELTNFLKNQQLQIKELTEKIEQTEAK